MQVCPTKSEPSSVFGEAMVSLASSACTVKLTGKKASNTGGAPRIPDDKEPHRYPMSSKSAQEGNLP